MNERIRELAEQAKQHALDAMRKIPDQAEALQVYTDVYDSTFAQLIVNECTDWINDNVGMIDEEARQDLLKHFGVEQ